MVKEKEETKGYSVVEIPIEHRRAIATPEEEIIGIEELLVKIANDIEEIKKSVLG